MGAGASYGRKETRQYNQDENIDDKRLIIREGLPIVKEIGPALLQFRHSIDTTQIIEDKEYTFFRRYRDKGRSIINEKDNLVKDIENLYIANKEYATIDTYARKLYLNKNTTEFDKLKNILCLFFVWSQVNSKPDQRYDTFLANILDEQLNLPKEICVISWNYDSQFEIAYRNYSIKRQLPVFDKNFKLEFPNKEIIYKLFKVNGSATFEDYNSVNLLMNNKDNDDINVKLIMMYSNLFCDTTELGFQFNSHLSFAWEVSNNQKLLFDCLKSETIDTEAVVVIGYSFPFFNREVDRIIFSNMPKLKTIYIQDLNPEAVEYSLRAVLSEECNIKIECIKDCTQFYMPREL